MKYVVKVKLVACASNYWLKEFIEGHYPCLTKDPARAERYESLHVAQDVTKKIDKFYKASSITVDPSPNSFS